LGISRLGTYVFKSQYSYTKRIVLLKYLKIQPDTDLKVIVGPSK